MPPTKSEERVRQARALSSNSSNSHIDKAWYRYALMGIGDDGLAFAGACMYFGIFQNDRAMLARSASLSSSLSSSSAKLACTSRCGSLATGLKGGLDFVLA